MKVQATQYFTDEYLEQCQKMKPKDILEFLESYRLMQAPKSVSRLISLKIPEDLLHAFKTKSELNGVKYQTMIKTLMRSWLEQ